MLTQILGLAKMSCYSCTLFFLKEEVKEEKNSIILMEFYQANKSILQIKTGLMIHDRFSFKLGQSSARMLDDLFCRLKIFNFVSVRKIPRLLPRHLFPTFPCHLAKSSCYLLELHQQHQILNPAVEFFGKLNFGHFAFRVFKCKRSLWQPFYG